MGRLQLKEYLPDGHAAHARVQHARPSAGAHLAGEREPFPPSNAVGLHRLPARANQHPSTYVFTTEHRWVLNNPELRLFLICSNSGLPSVLEMTLNILLIILTALMTQPLLHNRFVGPIGAPDLWAGPWWSFQSRVRRPDLCCRGRLAVAGPVCGDKACKVSRFFKSPHETSFYWLKWFTIQWPELESQLPGRRKRIYHIRLFDLGWAGLG